jgi:hypothetical protein
VTSRRTHRTDAGPVVNDEDGSPKLGIAGYIVEDWNLYDAPKIQHHRC